MRIHRAPRWWLVVGTTLLALLLAGSTANALPYWQTETVDSVGVVGAYTSLAFDNQGNPHISYFDSTNDDLKYASLSDGSWSSVTVDSAGYVGQFTSLAFDSQGNPHISYYDFTNKDLKYASLSDGSWSSVTVDSAGDVGEFTSLAFDSQGNPHISYLDFTNVVLKYASLSDGSWSSVTVDSAGFVGEYTSLAFDSQGNPHISYYDAGNNDLKYASLSNGSWSSVTVDSAGDVGQFNSLAFDNQGTPHISYFNVSNNDLKYASLSDGSWSSVTVNSAGGGGAYTSLVFDSQDSPHISYSDFTHDDVKYASLSNGSWSSMTVDSASGSSAYTSLAFDSQDSPHISYYDADNSNLKYASVLDDPTAPVTTANASLYSFGDWTNQPVSITLSATDTGGSGVANTFYTLNSGSQQTYTTGTPISITAEGTTTLAYWSTDVAGNEETHHTVSIKIDTTPPTATGSPTTSPNVEGWYNTAVTIQWSCDDVGGSGVATCPVEQTIGTEGFDQTASASVSDYAGNTGTVTSAAVNIDMTNPTISYTGNQGNYTVDQTITIDCQAVDSLSGIASTDCQDITGSAASFALGVNTVSSTATDNAGNVGSGSITFTVGVTYDSLCRLTEQYASNSRTGQQLCAPLQLVELGQRMHNSQLEQSAIDTYILLVNSQRGHGLSTSEADTLIQMARSLR